MVSFRTQRAHRTPSTPDWQIEVVTRTGAPPLRFAAHRLARDTCAESGQNVTLWARKGGGYVVAYGRYVHDIVTQFAETFSNIDDAALHLEELCARRDILMPAQADLMTRLSWDMAQMAYRQRFMVLVGNALAHWDDVLGPLETH